MAVKDLLDSDLARRDKPGAKAAAELRKSGIAEKPKGPAGGR